MFVHAVYFWLNDGTPESVAEQMLDDCDVLLSNVPTVISLVSGRPAMTPRDVVDNTYDIGLLVMFDDAEGHDVYATHPLHVQFIEKYKRHWMRVQVYDFQ